jgi:hypothetical protein
MANALQVGKGASKYDVIIAKNALTKKNLLGHLKSKKKGFNNYRFWRAKEIS